MSRKKIDLKSLRKKMKRTGEKRGHLIALIRRYYMMEYQIAQEVAAMRDSLGDEETKDVIHLATESLTMPSPQEPMPGEEKIYEWGQIWQQLINDGYDPSRIKEKRMVRWKHERTTRKGKSRLKEYRLPWEKNKCKTECEE